MLDSHDIKINNYFFKVDYVEPVAEGVHGLSVKELQKLSNNKGFKDNINLIKRDFDNADLLVGHNISFDLKFITSEYSKSGSNFSYNDILCTMKYFTNICKISKSKGSGYKWPRLEELTSFFNISDQDIMKTTEKLFKARGLGYHDARFDTVATYLSYMRGLEKGLIFDKNKIIP